MFSLARVDRGPLYAVFVLLVMAVLAVVFLQAMLAPPAPVQAHTLNCGNVSDHGWTVWRACVNHNHNHSRTICWHYIGRSPRTGFPVHLVKCRPWRHGDW